MSRAGSVCGGHVSLRVRAVGPVTADVDWCQSVDPECSLPGVRAGPDTDLRVVAAVPRDLPHTDSPADGPLAEVRVVPPEPGHPAGAARLPLLGVPLVGQLSAGVPLEPEPAGLEGTVAVKTRHGGAVGGANPAPALCEGGVVLAGGWNRREIRDVRFDRLER